MTTTTLPARPARVSRPDEKATAVLAVSSGYAGAMRAGTALLVLALAAAAGLVVPGTRRG